MKRKAIAGTDTKQKYVRLEPSCLSISEQLARIGDADFRYFHDFVSDHRALFSTLEAKIPWQQEYSIVRGKRFVQPRKTCLLGDRNRIYTYAGIRRNVFPLFDELKAFMETVTTNVQSIYPNHPPYTSVIANYYANGDNCIGMHSDNLAGLVPNTVIASVTLGTVRMFVIYTSDGKRVCSLPLASGSMLVMGKDSQTKYKHAVPRQKRIVSGRINLTFRVVLERLDPENRNPVK